MNITVANPTNLKRRHYSHLFLLLSTLFLISCRSIEHNLEYGNLVVVDRNEIKGGGDDVMLGAIYFTSNFGVVGSSSVAPISITKLQDNVGTGGIVGRASTRRLDFDWSRFLASASATERPLLQSYSQTAAELFEVEQGFSFEGVIVLAVEEDHVGDAAMNSRFNSAVARITRGLQNYIEDPTYLDSVDDALSRLSYISEKLGCFQQYASNGRECGSASGGISGGAGPLFPNIGHDMIGSATILFVGSENRLLITGIRNSIPTNRLFEGRVVQVQGANCGGASAADFHVCEFVSPGGSPVNNSINLLFSGEDAIWTLQTNNITRFE